MFIDYFIKGVGFVLGVAAGILFLLIFIAAISA